MPKIQNITSREILDSRGNPTLETTVYTDTGLKARAAVPSGASKGIHEAVELRDHDKNRYHGQGVLSAISAVNSRLNSELKGSDCLNQELIDSRMKELDGTENKSNLGANSILSVSLAVARAAALSEKKELFAYIQSLYGEKIASGAPLPMFNIVNGGLHGSGQIDFQEYLLICKSSTDFSRNFRQGSEIYHDLKKYLKDRQMDYAVGDEGGFTPKLSSNSEPLKILREVIENSPYAYGKQSFLGLDLASSTFYDQGKYILHDSANPLSSAEFSGYIKSLASEYNLWTLEDALAEDDWENWSVLTGEIGKERIIIGDDLLATNKKRLEKAISTGACNAILVKVNQIGTLSETLEVVRLAKKSGFKVVISHRSGETTDDFIADLAAGTGADFVKFGAPARGERVAKYNRLMEIYQKD